MTEPTQSPDEPPKSRWRNFWQLDIPLVFAVALCTVFTVIEVRRAAEGVWRAWAYAFEWPMIGLFCLWIWYRYRKEGNVTKGLAARWRARVDRITAEAKAQPSPPAALKPVDPDLDAWQSYLGDLHRREPPGKSPGEEHTR